MNELEAINLRQSRRGYLKTPIAKDSVTALKASIDKYNKESGLSIQLIEDGSEAFEGFTASYGFFSGVQSYIAIVGKTNDDNRRVKAGYYGQKLVLQAVQQDLGTCWVGGTFKRSRLTCTIGKDESLINLIIIGNVAEKKGFKENTIYKIAHRGTKPVEKLYVSDTAVPDWFINGMTAVQKAPSAVNHQPVLFTHHNGIVTAKVDHFDGHEAIDLGIAMLHFEIGAGRGRFEQCNNGKLIL